MDNAQINITESAHELDVIVSEDNMANIHVTFNTSELMPYQKEYLKEKRKHVILRGYRKGTVPADMIAKYFTAEAKDASINNLLHTKYIKLLQEHKLQPLTQPTLTKLITNDNEVVADFNVEVLQPVNLNQYLGLEIQAAPSYSLDDELTAMLQKIKHSYPKLTDNAELTANIGNVVTVSFSIIVDNVEFEKQEDLKVLLGSGLYYGDFETNLVGLKINEVKEFDIDFPDTYQKDELKGKRAHFNVIVKQVSEVSEYNDDELAIILKYADKEAMIVAIKQEIENKYKEEHHLFYENQILGQLLATHQFKLPNTLLNNEINKVMVEKPELTREQAMEVAERFVRTDLILSAIYERHPDIHLTDEAFNAHVAELAVKAKDSVENVIKRLQETNKLQIYFNYLKNCRVIDFLIDMSEKRNSVELTNVGEETNG